MFRAKHLPLAASRFLCNYMNMNAVPEFADTDAKVAAARRDAREVCREQHDYLKNGFDELGRRFDKIERMLTVILVLLIAQFFGFDGPRIAELLGSAF